MGKIWRISELLENWYNRVRGSSGRFEYEREVYYLQGVEKDVGLSHFTGNGSTPEIRFIRIRCGIGLAGWPVLGSMIRCGWNEESGVLTLGLVCGDIENRRVWLRFGRYNLIPVRILDETTVGLEARKCSATVADIQSYLVTWEPPRLGRSAAKHSTLDEILEAGLDPGYVSEDGGVYMTSWAISNHRIWKKNNQFEMWMAMAREKPGLRWAIEPTSLDCDGYDEHYQVPMAAGHDLRKIKDKLINKKTSHAVHYCEEAGHQRLMALSCGSPTFNYEDDGSGTQHASNLEHSGGLDIEARIVRVTTWSPKKWTETFRELDSRIIGRCIWLIFSMGYLEISESMLSFTAPTILWNLHLRAQQIGKPFKLAVVHAIQSYREYAMTQQKLGSSHTVERVESYIERVHNDLPIRPTRTATLKRRAPSSRVSRRRGEAEVSSPENPESVEPAVVTPVAASELTNDEPDYTENMSNLLAVRTLSYYSKPRYKRPFQESTVVLCKCSRCVKFFKNRDINQTIDIKAISDSEDLLDELNLRILPAEDHPRALKPHSALAIEHLHNLANESIIPSHLLSEILEIKPKPTPPNTPPMINRNKFKRNRFSCIPETDLKTILHLFVDNDNFLSQTPLKLSAINRKLLYQYCANT